MLDNFRNKIYNLLRWSEKYTKTDMVYLATGGFWLTIGQIVSTASSFLLAIAFANLLPKETYGVYRYILSTVGILSIPALAGMSTAATQAVARGYEGILIPAVKTKIKWGSLGSLASLAFAGYYYFHGDPTLTISFLIVAIFLPFMDAFTIYDALLQGRKIFKASVKYFIITQVVAASSLIATLLFTKNIFLILLAYFIPWAGFRFIFFKITLKKYSPNDKKDPRAISYGKHLSIIGIVETIANYLDQVLVFHYIGAVELAIYSFAIAPPEQIKDLLRSVSILALPKFSQKPKEEIKKTMLGKTLKLTLLIAMGIAIYILAAPLIFKIFFPKYLSSVIYSQIFAISLVSAAATLPKSALRGHVAKKELYILSTAGSLIQIGLLFFFIYFYGLMGAILARVATRFLNSFLTLYLAKRAEVF